MNGFTYRLVATERKGHVTHAAGDLGVWQILGDVLTAVDEINRVVVVLFNPCGNGKDVRVEDDVFGCEADLINQNTIGAFTDFVLTLLGIGLAFFIKGHNDNGRAIAFATLGFLNELLFAFFE